MIQQVQTLSSVVQRIQTESAAVNAVALQGSGGGAPSAPPLALVPVRTFSETIVTSSVTANLSTPTRIATYPVPTGMKGKSGFLQGYFYVKNQVAWPQSLAMNYGFALDDTLLGTVGGQMPLFRHTISTDTLALGGSSNVYASGGFTVPQTIPVSVPSGASNFYAVISNSTSPMYTTQVGAVATTTFTYTGSVQTYTVPADIARITIHLWGAGGSTGVATGGNAGSGGSGAYVSGTLAVSPGQILYLVLGNYNAGGLATGGGAGNASAGTEGDGGGFTAVFSANPTSMTVNQALAVLLALAGGGGGGGVNSGNVGAGGGVTTGLTANGTGGTQSAGGSGGNGGSSTGSAGSLLAGGGGANGGGGGGGGYYGGGGGGMNFGVNQGYGGGGGSSFLGSLTSIVSENGKTGYNAPGGENTMYSFFGSTARWGWSGGRGAVAIVTQGTYPTYVGSELNVIY